MSGCQKRKFQDFNHWISISSIVREHAGSLEQYHGPIGARNQTRVVLRRGICRSRMRCIRCTWSGRELFPIGGGLRGAPRLVSWVDAGPWLGNNQQTDVWVFSFASSASAGYRAFVKICISNSLLLLLAALAARGTAGKAIHHTGPGTVPLDSASDRGRQGKGAQC